MATGSLSPGRSDLPHIGDVQPAFSSPRVLTGTAHSVSFNRFSFALTARLTAGARGRPRLSGYRVRTRLPRRASPLLASDFQLRTCGSSFRTSTSRPSSGYELAWWTHCGVSGTREARGAGGGGAAVGGAGVTGASVRSAVSRGSLAGQPAGSPVTPVPSTTARHGSPRTWNSEQF